MSTWIKFETEKIKINSDENCARQSPSGSAAMPRFLVAVNFALRAACHGTPPDLLRYVSSFQKVLRYFLGALLICSVYSFRRALVFGARARSARVTARRQPHRQLCRRLVSRLLHIFMDTNFILRKYHYKFHEQKDFSYCYIF